MRCSLCGQENIPGADLCENCGADLAGLDLPEASRGFSGSVLRDDLANISLEPALVLDPEASIADAVALMRRERHGCVIIEENRRVAGIFTERDLLSRVLVPGLDPGKTRLAEVMTPDVMTIEPGDPVAFAIHRTVAQGFRHLPVVEAGKLLGFVSVRNLLGYVHNEVAG